LPHPELGGLAAGPAAEVAGLHAQADAAEPVSDVTDEVLSEEPVGSSALGEDPDALLDRFLALNGSHGLCRGRCR